MAEDDQNQDLAPLPLQPLPPPVDRPASNRSQAILIVFALVSSNMFALLLGCIFEFLSLRGVVDVGASRIVLAGAWMSGVIIIVVWVWGKGISAKWRTLIGGSMILAALMVCLDLWAPKATVVVDPGSITYDTSMHKEFFTFPVRNQTDSYVYGVQLKFVAPLDSSQNEFSFDLAADSRKPIIEGSDLADIGGVLCQTKDKHPMAIFLIYRIEPHGRREFKLTHNVDRQSHIDAAITSFKTTPLPRTDDFTTMMGNVHVTEPMTCGGCIGFLVDPTKHPIAHTCTGKKL